VAIVNTHSSSRRCFVRQSAIAVFLPVVCLGVGVSVSVDVGVVVGVVVGGCVCMGGCRSTISGVQMY